MEFSPEDLEKLGMEILRRKFAFKVREGFSLENLPIPRRALETPTPFGQLSEEFLREALREMEKILRGEDGVEGAS